MSCAQLSQHSKAVLSTWRAVSARISQQLWRFCRALVQLATSTTHSVSVVAQVSTEKFARYFDVEARLVPVEDEQWVMHPDRALDMVDENTIGARARLLCGLELVPRAAREGGKCFAGCVAWHVAVSG